jgi:hypothetical protein
MEIYAIGYLAIYAILALLYRHAWRLRDRLGLTPLEAFDTRAAMRAHLLLVMVGVISLALAVGGDLTGQEWTAFFSGIVFMFIGPLMWVHGSLSGKRRRLVMAAGARAEQPPGTPAPDTPTPIPEPPPAPAPDPIPDSVPELPSVPTPDRIGMR